MKKPSVPKEAVECKGGDGEFFSSGGLGVVKVCKEGSKYEEKDIFKREKGGERWRQENKAKEKGGSDMGSGKHKDGVMDSKLIKTPDLARRSEIGPTTIFQLAFYLCIIGI